jgi:hypothetical protein
MPAQAFARWIAVANPLAVQGRPRLVVRIVVERFGML